MIYYDIETEPLPEEQLRAICPEFDPEAVRCGNLGTAKAEVKIAVAKAKHFLDFCERAALSPFTGKVCAIGLAQDDGEVQLLDGAAHLEPDALARFWAVVESSYAPELCGFNTHRFDLPFLIKRSWMLGVRVPRCMRLEKDRYWPQENIDLRKIWLLGEYEGSGSLDDIARALGLAGKTGAHGKEFGRLWREDRATAEAYLRQDVELCRKIHARLAWEAMPLGQDCTDEVPFL